MKVCDEKRLPGGAKFINRGGDGPTKAALPRSPWNAPSAPCASTAAESSRAAECIPLCSADSKEMVVFQNGSEPHLSVFEKGQTWWYERGKTWVGKKKIVTEREDSQGVGWVVARNFRRTEAVPTIWARAKKPTSIYHSLLPKQKGRDSLPGPCRMDRGCGNFGNILASAPGYCATTCCERQSDLERGKVERNGMPERMAAKPNPMMGGMAGEIPHGPGTHPPRPATTLPPDAACAPPGSSQHSASTRQHATARVQREDSPFLDEWGRQFLDAAITPE